LNGAIILFIVPIVDFFRCAAHIRLVLPNFCMFLGKHQQQDHYTPWLCRYLHEFQLITILIQVHFLQYWNEEYYRIIFYQVASKILNSSTWFSIFHLLLDSNKIFDSLLRDICIRSVCSTLLDCHWRPKRTYRSILCEFCRFWQKKIWQNCPSFVIMIILWLVDIFFILFRNYCSKFLH
jgi:hypothetical protein